jgi:hypothetical protein
MISAMDGKQARQGEMVALSRLNDLPVSHQQSYQHQSNAGMGSLGGDPGEGDYWSTGTSGGSNTINTSSWWNSFGINTGTGTSESGTTSSGSYDTSGSSGGINWGSLISNSINTTLKTVSSYALRPAPGQYYSTDKNGNVVSYMLPTGSTSTSVFGNMGISTSSAMTWGVLIVGGLVLFSAMKR